MLVEAKIDSLVSTDDSEEEMKKIESYMDKIKSIWEFFDLKIKIDNNACRNMPMVMIKFDGNRRNWLSFRELFVSRQVRLGGLGSSVPDVKLNYL